MDADRPRPTMQFAVIFNGNVAGVPTNGKYAERTRRKSARASIYETKCVNVDDSLVLSTQNFEFPRHFTTPGQKEHNCNITIPE